MRINWFSPVPPARTDIANYSARVIPWLKEAGAEVKVWSSERSWDPNELPNGIAVSSGSGQHLPWPEINFRDFTVYQIGNDARFHSAILAHAEHHGGIVVLHDINLHETQRMRFVVESHQPGRYLALLAEAGGDDAAAEGRSHLSGETPLSRLVERFPLTASALRGTHGVIIHNPAAIEQIRALTPAPVAALPLPYREASDLPAPHRRSWDRKRRLRLVMFGFIHGTNRRLQEILATLARKDLRDRFELDLFGELSLDFDLAGTLASHRLNERVRFHGFLEEDEIDQILASADLALNLRRPSLGEASGGLLRIWSHSLCAIVSDNGFYTSLSDEVVVRIAADAATECEELADALLQFSAEPAPFYERGIAARQQLEDRHTPSAYVARLLPFMALTRKYRSRAYLERYLPQLTHAVIGSMPDRYAQSYWVDRIAELTAEGFGLPTENPLQP